MIERLIPQVSSFARAVDGQILLITLFVGFWFIVAEVAFFYLIFKFRHREGQKGQYITGEVKSEKRWVTIPHMLVLICDIFIIVGAVRVWMEVKQTLPPADHTVRIMSQQWAWVFTDPGPDNLIDTPDDVMTTDEMHVEVNKTYHFKLAARDVLHSFSVPVFRLKQDAVPGREIVGWFKAEQTGTFDIQCAEICGIGHGIMGARLIVETPEQHAAWLRGFTNVQASR